MDNRFTGFFLGQFDKSEFVIQQKARALLYFSMFLLAGDLIYLIFFLITGNFDRGVLYPACFFIFGIILLLAVFRMGMNALFSHGLLVTTVAILWVVNFLDSGPLLQRADTVVLVIAALNITPLVFLKSGREIIFYYLINIVVMVAYSLYLGSEFGLLPEDIFEYMMDNTVALLFMAFFGYRVYTINQRALERYRLAEEEIQGQYKVLSRKSDELEEMNSDLFQMHRELLDSNSRIAEEKERLDATLRNIGDGVIAFNSEGAINSINRAAEEILSIPSGYAHGREIFNIFDPMDMSGRGNSENPVKDVLLRGATVEIDGDVIITGKDEQGKIISGIITPLYDPKGFITGGVLAFRDITEQKRMQDELFKASKIESLGVFAGGIAHDFNNLLTAILGNISIARLNLDRENCNVEFLVEAEKASLRAKGLTEQLLTFSKGGAPIKTTVSLKAVIEETSSFVLSGSQLQCVCDISEDLWNADADRGQISQVIHNITLNARQAMRDAGTVRITAKNSAVTRYSGLPLEDGNFVKISIEDEGDGIPPEIVPKIFDPFFTTKIEGSGLGLAVTSSIIKKHGGCITVSSKQGKGTVFRFYLPASSGKVADENVEVGEEFFCNTTILLMDDDRVVLKVGENMLKRLGCSVITSSDGEKAIDIYRKHKEGGRPFSAVIMDLTVPGAMGGRDAVAVLREYDPDLRAIVSSGYANDPVMASYREYGFSGYVVKPYKIEELRKALAEVMV